MVNACKGLRDLQEKDERRNQIGAEIRTATYQSLLNDNCIDDPKRALEDPAFSPKTLEEYGIDSNS